MPTIQIWPLRGWQLVQSRDRSRAIDVLRGLAIVAVVLYHADVLPIGFLGVDLFFVISGYLVGGLLVRPLLAGSPIHFSRFILSRGFKIWPSYYLFLLLGEGAAYLLYHRSHPDQVIPLSDLPMYLFFYRNYRGGFHWSFDHLWSLCVEEHFYFFLPLFILGVKKYFNSSVRALLVGTGLLIALGIVGKVLGWLIHFETRSATHNRVDALAWGILLMVLHQHFGWQVPQRWRAALLLGSLAALGSAATLYAANETSFFSLVIFQSLTPVFFASALWACLDMNIQGLKTLRLCGYYSYNWYLWHMILGIYFKDQQWNPALQAPLFLLATFVLAITFTVLVEEPFLRMRKPFLDRHFA
ncbi:MAG: acyltransferase family protein [Bdellovibrionota bacterium]